MSPPTKTISEPKEVPAKKARQAKKARDTPSRPLSAYNFFFRDERAQILAEREEQAKTTGKEPDKTGFFSILGKTIAARWKSKTEEDRQKYKEMAAKDMKRYRAEMEHYHESIANSLHEEEEETMDDSKSTKTKKKKKGRKKTKSGVVSQNDPQPESEVKPAPNTIDRNMPMASMNVSMQLPHMTAPTSAAMAGLQVRGLDASSVALSGTGLDLLAYQSLLQQRELAALREQSLAFSAGLSSGSPNLLRSLGRGGLDQSALLGSPSRLFSANLLTPEEQLLLLRRSQDAADISLRQCLDLTQRAPEALSQLTPSTLALLQERQRLLARQRMEILLSASGHPPLPPGGP